jgi:(S)-ureidoglycine aminohydrolase
MGYPADLLSTRAVVKPGLYAVIPKDGLVNNVIPGIEGCRVSILASPKMGASFVEYIISAEPGGGTKSIFAMETGIESFIFCIKGELDVTVDGTSYKLTDGGYAYCPAEFGMGFKNNTDSNTEFLLYKQKYIPVGQYATKVCIGNVNDIEYRIYEGMENVLIKDLLPTDPAFDMNMHILSFKPGGCHPFVETHVQEHGAYVLSGEGVYLLDDAWRGIKKDDFLWFGPYVAQASYGVGREDFTYIYSKDCNRDVVL